MASGTTTADAPPARRRDRTHWLYIAVIVAVLLGIAVGFDEATMLDVHEDEPSSATNAEPGRRNAGSAERDVARSSLH